MKYFKKFTALLLLSAGIFILGACNKKTEDTATNTGVTTVETIKSRGKLRVGVKIDVPGFGYQDPDTGQVEGMEADLARKLAERITGSAENVEFIGVTAKTRGPLLDNGEIDMVIATFTITEDRKKSYNFTAPYYTDEVGFLVRKEDGFTDLASLDGKIIGVAQTATTKQSIEAQGQEEGGLTFKFGEFGTYPMLKLALSAGRIDAFSVDKSILLGYVDEQTEILDIGFAPQEYGIATKLANKKLASYLDETVAEFRSDGVMQELFDKWNIKDTSNQ